MGGPPRPIGRVTHFHAPYSVVASTACLAWDGRTAMWPFNTHPMRSQCLQGTRLPAHGPRGCPRVRGYSRPTAPFSPELPNAGGTDACPRAVRGAGHPRFQPAGRLVLISPRRAGWVCPSTCRVRPGHGRVSPTGDAGHGRCGRHPAHPPRRAVLPLPPPVPTCLEPGSRTGAGLECAEPAQRERAPAARAWVRAQRLCARKPDALIDRSQDGCVDFVRINPFCASHFDSSHNSRDVANPARNTSGQSRLLTQPMICMSPASVKRRVQQCSMLIRLLSA